jgi:hypothetical protein
VLDELNASYTVYAFGELVTDFGPIPGAHAPTSPSPLVPPSLLAPPGTHVVPKLSSISGAKIFGRCLKFPSPVLAVVFSDGDTANGCDEFPGEKFKMWAFPKGTPVATLKHSIDTAENVFSPRLDVNADFHIHDVKLEGTTVSGFVSAYLNFHQSLPLHDIDITPVNSPNLPFAIDISQLIHVCAPVYTVGVLSMEVCYYPNPNRVCGSVTVSVHLPWPIGDWSRTFDLACVTF